MFELDLLETLFVLTAFLFQSVLIIHFALRKWRFDTAIRYGPIVYLLSIPSFAVSILLLLGGMTWSLWLGGLLYVVWAIYGYVVEYVKKSNGAIPSVGPSSFPMCSCTCPHSCSTGFPWRLLGSRCGMQARFCSS